MPTVSPASGRPMIHRRRPDVGGRLAQRHHSTTRTCQVACNDLESWLSVECDDPQREIDDDDDRQRLTHLWAVLIPVQGSSRSHGNIAAATVKMPQDSSSTADINTTETLRIAYSSPLHTAASERKLMNKQSTKNRKNVYRRPTSWNIDWCYAHETRWATNSPICYVHHGRFSLVSRVSGYVQS